MLKTFPCNALLLFVFSSLLIFACFTCIQTGWWSRKCLNLRLEVTFSRFRFAQVTSGLLTLFVNGHFILICPETIKASLVCSSEISIWPQKFWWVLSGSCSSHSFRNSNWIRWPNEVISSCYTLLSGLREFFCFFFWSQDLTHHRTNLVVLSIHWSVLYCRIHSLAFFNNTMHRICSLSSCIRLWSCPLDTLSSCCTDNRRILISVLPISVDEIIFYSDLWQARPKLCHVIRSSNIWGKVCSCYTRLLLLTSCCTRVNWWVF
jgi:hypothetical protein